MTLAEDFWLRGKTAQDSIMKLWAVNTALAGAVTVEAWKMGVSAPTGFWHAIGRVGGVQEADVAVPPKPTKKSKKAPATPKAVKEVAKGPAPVAKLATAPKKAKPKAKAKTAPAPVVEIVTGPSPHLLDAPRGGKADDLTALKGVGSKLATSLNEFGIYHFDQIATLDAEGIDWLNEQQAGFKMLCARYKLVEQARARLT